MIPTAEQFLAAALRLSISERGTIAAELLASMDGDRDPDAPQDWAAEIERRAERAHRGQSRLSVRDDIERKRRIARQPDGGPKAILSTPGESADV